MGGTLFIESVYGLPGIGRVAVLALRTFDLPVILGVVVVVTTVIVILNLITDLLYGFLDPRVRVSASPDSEVAPRETRRAAKASTAPVTTTAR
jgi:ABC-type dipeptide/oligopeptide/nickel transport system permease component